MMRLAVTRFASARLTSSRRDRRVLALGSAVLGALLGGSHGVPAWRKWVSESRASALELSGQVARVRAAMPLRKALRDTVRARRARLVALDSGLVEGDTPPTAAAALASMLSDAAREAGVKFGAVQMRPDSARAGTTVTRVAVRADAVGDVRGLTLLLLALEEGPALLRVRELAITQPEPSAPDAQPEALRIELLVEGLARTPSPPAGPKPAARPGR